MAIYIFDVDGVLTDTGCTIDDNFKEWFISWASDKTYVLATGNTLEKTIERVGSEIVKNSFLCATCVGNIIYQNGKNYIFNEINLTDDEAQFLNQQVSDSDFTIHVGNHIEHRVSSINFSVLGRSEDVNYRELYKLHDIKTGERLNILKQLNEKFERFDVFIGGNTSLDICLRSANKSNVVKLLSNIPNVPLENKLYFFGDQLHKFGIDYPLAQAVLEEDGKVFEIKNGYNETKQILEPLL